MSLECSCIRLLTVPLKKYQWLVLPRKVLFYNSFLSQQARTCFQELTPTMHCYCPLKVSAAIFSQVSLRKPLLSSIQPYNYVPKIGLKYNTNYKRNLVKEFKYKEFTKGSKGHDVMKGVRRVLQDKTVKLHQTEERWKRRSRIIIDDFKETKTKIKEKMEEIIEVSIPNKCIMTFTFYKVCGKIINVYIIIKEQK